mmetsp:Transcript_34660/g.70796  ORF Transcript_34660/g.70796 Transcript_34660/m.70796 type:complete len:201 (+) Transcript_34660:223-825(+)
MPFLSKMFETRVCVSPRINTAPMHRALRGTMPRQKAANPPPTGCEYKNLAASHDVLKRSGAPIPRSACMSVFTVSAGWVSKAAACPASTDAAKEAAVSLWLKNFESSRKPFRIMGARPRNPKVHPASRMQVAVRPRFNLFITDANPPPLPLLTKPPPPPLEAAAGSEATMPTSAAVAALATTDRGCCAAPPPPFHRSATT